MPRYYFDIREGDDVTVDGDGMELPTLEVAWAEAARAATEMARDAIPKHGNSGHRMTIEVRETKKPVLSINVTFETRRHST